MLQQRVVIEHAKGVIAERAGIEISEAFSRHRHYARGHALRLVDVARSAIDGTLDSRAWVASIAPGNPAQTSLRAAETDDCATETGACGGEHWQGSLHQLFAVRPGPRRSAHGNRRERNVITSESWPPLPHLDKLRVPVVDAMAQQLRLAVDDGWTEDEAAPVLRQRVPDQAVLRLAKANVAKIMAESSGLVIERAAAIVETARRHAEPTGWETDHVGPCGWVHGGPCPRCHPDLRL